MAKSGLYLALYIVGALFLLAAVSSAAFTDRTSAAGINYVQSVLQSDNNQCIITNQQCVPDRQTGGAAAADYDNDGFVDLFVTVLDGPDILFHNQGDGTFVDVSNLVGLSVITSTVNSNGALWLDVDNDGDQDLYVTTLGTLDDGADNRYFLFINDLSNSGKFIEDADARSVSLNDGSSHIGQTAVVGDINRDGWVDIVVGQWTQRTITQHTRILMNTGNGFFVDATDDLTNLSSFPTEFNFAPVLADFDRDGWQDLLIIGDFGTSKFYWNNQGTFVESEATNGCCTDAQGHAASVADYNRDGYLDYFVSGVSSTTSCGSPCGNRLFLFNPANRGFVDSTNLYNVRHSSMGYGCAFGDFDNDRDYDIVVTTGVVYNPPNNVAQYENDPMSFFQNAGTGVTTDTASAQGLTDTASGKGLITFDYNNDGKKDIFIAHNGGNGILYRNDDNSGRNWIKVKLEGITSSTEGIGAQVTILAGGQTFYQEVGPNDHFLGHSDRTVHVGLGALTVVDSITVYWPVTGLTSTQHNVPVNQLVTITEPIFGFTDVTSQAGVVFQQSILVTQPNCIFNSASCVPDRMTGGAAASDYNGDGFIDLYVTRLNAPGILYRNNGDGTFSDVTTQVGLDVINFHGNGALWCDIDNDGDQDLYVTTLGTTSQPSINRFFLFVNLGVAGFQEEAVARGVDLSTGVNHFGTSATCGDFDNDGNLDIHVNQWAGSTLNLATRHSRLFHNLGNGHFEDVTQAQGINNPSRLEYNMASVFTDLDRDGWVDLLIAGDQGTSQYYKNDHGNFVDRTSTLPSVTFSAHGLAVGDLNNDGYNDWYISATGTAPNSNAVCGSTCGSRLYSFNASSTNTPFIDSTAQRQLQRGFYGNGAAFGDYDNDGDLDLAVATGANFIGGQAADASDPLLYYSQLVNPNLPLSEGAQEVGLTNTGVGRPLIHFDYDNDGDLDLFLVNTGGGGVLYRNDHEQNGNSWLEVKARGTVSNAIGAGAQVTVTVTESGPVLYREIGTDVTLQGHSNYAAHFGLGAGTAPIFKVEVYWPAFNRLAVFRDVDRNQILTAFEPLQPSPTATNTPSISKTRTSTPSISGSATPSPSFTPSASPTTIVIGASPSRTPSVAPSAYIVTDQEGPGTSIVITLSGRPVKRSVAPKLQIQATIANYLNISPSQVFVYRLTQFEAAVLICDQDQVAVVGFINAVNFQSNAFDGTILEDSSISNVLFDVDCNLSESYVSSFEATNSNGKTTAAHLLSTDFWISTLPSSFLSVSSASQLLVSGWVMMFSLAFSIFAAFWLGRNVE